MKWFVYGKLCWNNVFIVFYALPQMVCIIPCTTRTSELLENIVSKIFWCWKAKVNVVSIKFPLVLVNAHIHTHTFPSLLAPIIWYAFICNSNIASNIHGIFPLQKKKKKRNVLHTIRKNDYFRNWSLNVLGGTKIFIYLFVLALLKKKKRERKKPLWNIYF